LGRRRARYLLPLKELPLGVVTAAIGGLFLIIAMTRWMPRRF